MPPRSSQRSRRSQRSTRPAAEGADPAPTLTPRLILRLSQDPALEGNTDENIDEET